jgi:twitching motility protein PilT
MEFSTEEEGMHTLDQALADLVRNGIVSREDAMMKSSNPAKLNQLLPLQKNASSSQTLDEAQTLCNRV